jgi:hypothetical protein
MGRSFFHKYHTTFACGSLTMAAIHVTIFPGRLPDRGEPSLGSPPPEPGRFTAVRCNRLVFEVVEASCSIPPGHPAHQLPATSMRSANVSDSCVAVPMGTEMAFRFHRKYLARTRLRPVGLLQSWSPPMCIGLAPLSGQASSARRKELKAGPNLCTNVR